MKRNEMNHSLSTMSLFHSLFHFWLDRQSGWLETDVFTDESRETLRFYSRAFKVVGETISRVLLFFSITPLITWNTR